MQPTVRGPMAYAPRGGFIDEAGYGLEEEWMGQQIAYSGAQPNASAYGPYLGTQPPTFSTGYPSSKPPTFPPPPPLAAEFGYQGEAADQRPQAGGLRPAHIAGSTDLLRVLHGAAPPPPPPQAPHVPPAQPTQPPPSAPQGPPPAAPPHQMMPGMQAAWSVERSRAGAEAEEKKDASNSDAERRAREKFGILGLLKVTSMREKDLNMLALGMDLANLGLSDMGREKDPEFYLPHCYYVNPPQLKTAHLQKFSLETLFYIFFNMPRDTLQAYAAAELYNRGWKFHRELKFWFILQEQEEGGPPRWVCFDPNSWERSFYNQYVDPNQFLAEDDVRVKNMAQQAG
mmetsp:Transcript_49638/g.91636  ORF Transcript_49638/g.91636 Transcript_49638/m.91636 type:complete len:342 (-) Transcript_49638:97-1122(-)